MKKYIIIGIIVLIILGGGGYFYYQNKNKPAQYDTVVAEKSTLVQEVSVTGQVKAAEDVSLAFETAGKAKEIFVNVGDKVTKGQKLVTMENASASAQLNQSIASLEGARAGFSQYQSALDSQRAKYNEYLLGTRPEEITIAETTVQNARKTLADAQTSQQNINTKATSDLNNIYDDTLNILRDAYDKAEYSVNTGTDAIFDNDRNDSPRFIVETFNVQNKIDTEWQRYSANIALQSMKSKLDAFPTSQSDLDQTIVLFEQKITIVKDFLNSAIEALNYSIGLSDTNLATYKASVNSGLTNVNASLSSITAQKQAIINQKNLNKTNIDSANATINTASNTLKSAEDNLALKKAGYTREQLNSQLSLVKQAEANVQNQQAQIRYAEANVQNLQAQYNKTILTSPIDGIVTEKNVKPGEIVSMNQTIIKIISEKKYQIEANVPEVDIANIKINDTSAVTLDAYGSDQTFEATVIKIDPAEIVIEGVPTYKVTLEFKENDEKIRSGMTANLDILTNKKENVIALPQRAVLKKDNQKIVRVLNSDGLNFHEVTVTTGLRGSNGNLEILTGVNEGDKIVVAIK